MVSNLFILERYINTIPFNHFIPIANDYYFYIYYIIIIIIFIWMKLIDRSQNYNFHKKKYLLYNKSIIIIDIIKT